MNGQATGPKPPAGPSTPPPPSGPKAVYDHGRAVAHIGAVLEGVLRRLAPTVVGRSRTVAEADAATSLADLRAAAWINEGVSPDDLDRNGLPASAGHNL